MNITFGSAFSNINSSCFKSSPSYQVLTVLTSPEGTVLNEHPASSSSMTRKSSRQKSASVKNVCRDGLTNWASRRSASTDTESQNDSYSPCCVAVGEH